MNPKQKGSAFERFVCQKLSLWLSDGKRKDLLWRSAMSGGRSTRGHKRGEDLSHQAGDICAVHPDGHILTNNFYIECKAYRNLKLDRFLLLGTGPTAEFWSRTKVEAKRYKRHPMLIAKQNNFPIIVVTERGIVLFDTFLKSSLDKVL